MSGWIKLEKAISSDLRFRRMVREKVECNDGALHESTAVTLLLGAIAQLWLYADEHIRDDNTMRGTFEDIDNFVGVQGFCSLMPRDWLVVLDADNVQLPDWIEHNGTVAKKRALTQKRVEKHRAKPDSNAPALRTQSISNAHALPDQTRPDQDQDQNKKRSIPSESHSDKSEIAIVFEHWKSVWDHPKASLDVKRSAAIKKALGGYSSADLCASISGYRNSPHHTGQNDRQTVYDDIGLFLRDSGHIDAGLRFAEKPAALTSDLANHNVRVLQEWGEAHARNGSSEISSDVSESRGGIRETAIAAAHGALLGRPKASGH